jgi:hypothetical protein
MFMADHHNNTKLTLGQSLYWSIVTLCTVGYGDVVPKAGVARALASVWMVVSVLALSAVTSILSSNLVADNMSRIVMNTWGDVTGTVCAEQNRILLKLWVQRATGGARTVIYDDLASCMAMLEAGTVQAVLADQPVLAWYIREYSSSDSLYVSAALSTLPYSFVYASNSALRTNINSGVISSLTDSDAVSAAEAIYTRWFGMPSSSVDDSTSASVSMPLVWTVVAMVGLCFVMHEGFQWWFHDESAATDRALWHLGKWFPCLKRAADRNPRLHPRLARSITTPRTGAGKRLSQEKSAEQLLLQQVELLCEAGEAVRTQLESQIKRRNVKGSAVAAENDEELPQ